MNLTSPSQVKTWCIENGFHPNKTLGQNFLVDKNILDVIIETAGVGPGDEVLEIGPGLGVLTEGLLDHGSRVVAIEKDRRLAERLQRELSGRDGAEVITADALEVDWDTLLSGHRFAASVSNLPYSVGTRILIDLAFKEGAPTRFVLLVQTEVADRFAAGPGEKERGQAGVWLQLDYDVTLVRQVKPCCFWPQPEVNSTIVRLDRHPCSLSARERRLFFALTRHSFMHRRKQLGTLLRKAPGILEAPAEEVLSRLERAGLPSQIRPEALTLPQWEALARIYAAEARDEER